MMSFPRCSLLSSTIACAVLVACASSTEPGAPTVVRTRAPLDYEKTISNYLAFRLRTPQKNTRLGFSAPEPGDCPLDGHPGSIRGWVVPVAHETFNGEPTGRDTIRITAKQYYFWFSGDTIAGVTLREDVCPGVVSIFDEPPRPGQRMPEPLPAAATDGLQRVRVDPAEPSQRVQNAAAPAKAKTGSAAAAKSAGAKKKVGTTASVHSNPQAAKPSANSGTGANPSPPSPKPSE